MAKKIVNLLVLIPLGIVLVIFCVANRQIVALASIPSAPRTRCWRCTRRFSSSSSSP
jgi:hypothetical protein